MSSVFLPGLDGPGSAVPWGRTHVASGPHFSPLGYSVPSTHGEADQAPSLASVEFGSRKVPRLP